MISLLRTCSSRKAPVADARGSVTAGFPSRERQRPVALFQHAVSVVIALLVPACASPLAASLVTGKVELVASRDPNVRRHRDFSGVVIWLEPARRIENLRPVRAEMIQKNKTFTPHVLPVTVGTTVNFPNFDPIFHNAFSSFNGQIFDVSLYPPGTSRAVTFTRDGIVRVFCNIHPTMSAVILVLDTPYFGITTKDGAFRIPDVPPGAYQLHIFHERASEGATEALERRVVVTSAALELPPMTISENGYLQLPHKNKYGRDYPPALDGHTVYPGARP